MTYQEFFKRIEKKDFAQIYFFSGAEDYLLQECVDKLIQAFVDPASKEFNFDIFYGDQADAGKIIDVANAYPMLTETRVVIVRDVQKLPAAGLDALARYLEKPSPTTRFIFTCGKADARNKAISKIKKASCLVELKPLYDNKVPGWIQSTLKQRGLRISQEACLLLHSHVGNNLRAIMNEIEKLQLNLQDGATIEASDVQHIVGLSRKHTIFDLTNAIGNKEVTKALTILNAMLSSGESPTGLLAKITWHFINLLKIKGAIAARKSEDEIVALTGIQRYFLSKTKPMVKNYSFARFREIFEILLTTEVKLKTSAMQPDVALQTMLVQIMR